MNATQKEVAELKARAKMLARKLGRVTEGDTNSSLYYGLRYELEMVETMLADMTKGGAK